MYHRAADSNICGSVMDPLIIYILIVQTRESRKHAYRDIICSTEAEASSGNRYMVLKFGGLKTMKQH